jgi:preprotein translocase subunit SecG
MYLLITIVHVIVCLFLTVVVLLQSGRGADAGAVFGGSSQTFFGSSGAGNFLTKLTSAMAIVFMITSLVLTYGAARRVGQSVFDDAPTPASTSTPATTSPSATPSNLRRARFPRLLLRLLLANPLPYQQRKKQIQPNRNCKLFQVLPLQRVGQHPPRKLCRLSLHHRLPHLNLKQ